MAKKLEKRIHEEVDNAMQNVKLDLSGSDMLEALADAASLQRKLAKQTSDAIQEAIENATNEISSLLSKVGVRCPRTIFKAEWPTKVDRSAAYASRYVAKNLVAAGLADKAELQVSYAIGVAEPTSISVDTFGTSKLEESKIIELVREHFDLRPYGLIEMLDLERPIYKSTAAYGHFGREEFPWEKTDKVEALRASAGL